MKTQTSNSNANRRATHSTILTFTSPGVILAATMLCLLWIPTKLSAIGANPEPYEIQQPNGVRFWAKTWGDEWQNGTETLDGYSILQDPNTNWWTYAVKDTTGNLVPSGSRVGDTIPSRLLRHLRADPPNAGALQTLRDGQSTAAQANIEAPSVAGSHKLLVVVVDFTPSVSLGTTELDWEHFFFTGGLRNAPRSVRDYWDAASYGQISIEPASETYGASDNGIVFVTLPTAHPIPASGDVLGVFGRGIVRDAILAADPFVDFARYDTNRDTFITTNELHLFFVIRGYEAAYGGSAACSDKPKVWAHRSALFWMTLPIVDSVTAGSLNTATFNAPERGGYTLMGEWHCATPNAVPGHMATIGVAVHELAHDIGMGAPDLYDTSSTTGTSSSGIGHWSLMATGAWGGKQISGWPGTHPALPDPWVRSMFGFISPREITTSSSVLLPQIETATGPDRGVLQILPNPNRVDWILGKQQGVGEYFLLENRQRVGDFDVALPGDGLLIWHIYEPSSHYNSRANSDEGSSPPGNPRLVVLEQADGRFDLECYSNPQNSSRCNSGDSTDPWKEGTARTFSDASTPSSKLYDGSSTVITVTNIGNSGSVMTANVALPGSSISSVVPSFHSNGVVNAASFQSASDPSSGISPGSLVTIFGSDLASFSMFANSVPLPDNLAGTAVLFNGIAAPLFYVSKSQINAQVPFDLPNGPVSVQVRRGSAGSETQTVQVATVSPGIFNTREGNLVRGAILHAATFQPVSSENPANPGESLSVFATGLGRLGQIVTAGRIASDPVPETISRPLASIGGIPAQVTYSGLAPGLVGVYQVNIRVPSGVSYGTQPVQILMDGVTSNIVSVDIGDE